MCGSSRVEHAVNVTRNVRPWLAMEAIALAW